MRIIMAVAVVLFAVVSADAQRGPSPEVGDLIYRPLEVAPTPPVLQKACWEDHIKEAEANGRTSWRLFYPECVKRLTQR
jgi:hypothetical protein